MKPQKKQALLVAGLLAALILAVGLSMIAGAAPARTRDLWNFLAHGDRSNATIFLDLRLCRAVLAFLVGACLSLSGAILQGYFQNSLADPFIVGVSSGASFGAVLCLAIGLQAVIFGIPVQSLMAFAAGFALVIAVYLLSQRRTVFKVETLLLTGISAGALASSLTSFLLFLRADSFEQAVFWLLGSLQLADWRQVATIAPQFLVCLFVAQWLAKDMNLLVLGDESARSLGSPVERVRKAYLAVATLLAAVSVSVAGIIGFVGLVVPHGVRIMIGPDHRRLFALSSLAGGVFLVACDLLARTILSPTELPIGIITAALGAPIFIYLLRKRT